MRTGKTVSITLPPDLLVKAQEVAHREHRTMSELFGEALRRYMQGEAEWQALLLRTRAKGRALGIKSEPDVERHLDEHRSSRLKAKRSTHSQEFVALKADIDKGLTDLAEGRLKNFDTARVIERGKKLLAGRCRSA